MSELKLSAELPDFMREMEASLPSEEHADLRVQIPGLTIVDRCRCGDSFCGMFYTAPPPEGSWGPGHENVTLEVTKGDVILDVVERKIVAVEVLDRDDVRAVIHRLLP
jgi:hypothetical protein